MALTLHGNGGATAEGDAVLTETVLMDALFPCPEACFLLTGHVQTGWNTAPDGTGETYLAGLPYAMTGELTLYAVYAPVSVTLTLEAAGGSCAVEGIHAVWGAVVEELPTATRAGYLFAGWWTPDGDEVRQGDTLWLSGDTVLTARWEPLVTVAGIPARIWLMEDGRLCPCVIRTAAGRARTLVMTENGEA